MRSTRSNKPNLIDQRPIFYYYQCLIIATVPLSLDTIVEINECLFLLNSTTNQFLSLV